MVSRIHCTPGMAWCYVPGVKELFLGTGGPGVSTCSMQGVGEVLWSLGTMCGHLQYAGSGGGVLGPGGREVQRGSHPRLEVELFTFFVVGAKDKDIFVDKSKIVGLGV